MGQNANAFDFLLGEWDIAMFAMPEGSSVGRRAISRVQRILDGTALFDEIRHVDETGQVNFRGASFRTYVPHSDAWYVVWMMANVEGYSELRADVVDGEVRTDGRGRDPGGELIERGRYYDIEAGSYRFTLDRSYDGGKQWIRPFVSFRATRRAAEEPSVAHGPMRSTHDEIVRLVDQGAGAIADPDRCRALRRILVEPEPHTRTWAYGPGQFECWTVARDTSRRMVLVYSRGAFGDPWGCLEMDSDDLGGDSQWYTTLDDAFIAGFWDGPVPEGYESS